MLKTCTKCMIEKNVTEFGKGSGTVDGLCAHCKECRRIYNRNWYKENKSYYIKRRQDRTQWFYDLKETLECIKCSENHPAALVFHHRNPKAKRFSIAKGHYRYSRVAVEKEIRKCDVLCANCHNILHWEMRNGNLRKHRGGK